VGALTAVLTDGDGPALVDELRSAVNSRPVGGFWAVYAGDDMEELLAVAEVLYAEHQGVVTFAGFNAFSPEQLTPETLDYVRFWRDVHMSSEASITLRVAHRLAA
jgi:hypothetical protein